MSLASIALNRFGLGARAGEAAPTDGKAWLERQFTAYDARPLVIAALPDSAAITRDVADYLDAQRQNALTRRAPAPMADQAKPDMADTTQKGDDPVEDAKKFARDEIRDHYVQAVAARLQVAMDSPAPFVERLVWFWANHFAVSADKVTMIGMAGAFEFEAIRPHVLGNFRDMLFAAERHPAMMLYLDQAQSIGPNSPLGQRVAANGKRKLGLNENLAREIMELHTLGVRTGYDQADVTEFARAMTGWTVGGLGRGPVQKRLGLDVDPGKFVFAPALHEPGARTIMGKRYDQPGENQAAAVLNDLSRHPATARHIATKLSRHFAGDDPPPAMVARVEAAFTASDGDLPTVYRAILNSPEAWVAQPVKFKTPWEWTVSSLRAIGGAAPKAGFAANLTNQLGQPIWKPGSPAGFDDIAASWAGPDAIMRRVEAASRLADRSSNQIDARALGTQLFPDALSAATAQAIARAESPGQGLALLLVSPESLRR